MNRNVTCLLFGHCSRSQENDVAITGKWHFVMIVTKITQDHKRATFSYCLDDHINNPRSWENRLLIGYKMVSLEGLVLDCCSPHGLPSICRAKLHCIIFFAYMWYYIYINIQPALSQLHSANPVTSKVTVSFQITEHKTTPYSTSKMCHIICLTVTLTDIVWENPAHTVLNNFTSLSLCISLSHPWPQVHSP